jgi:hypothetical protein
MKIIQQGRFDLPMMVKYAISGSFIAFAEDELKSQAWGLSVLSQPTDRFLKTALVSNPCKKDEAKAMAIGAGAWQALYLHAFLLQYRESGTVLPQVRGKVVVQKPHAREIVERDITWALKLLLPPVVSRDALIERLHEADAARLAAWGDEAYLPESHVTEICFETACYQRYLKFRGHPDSPPEPPVATHEEIVAWLQGGRPRTPQPNGEALCSYCLIDRRDGSWSIYGWNDADGADRYPPEEIIRYYDEAMAYEFLLNAALQAVV